MLQGTSWTKRAPPEVNQLDQSTPLEPPTQVVKQTISFSKDVRTFDFRQINRQQLLSQHSNDINFSAGGRGRGRGRSSAKEEESKRGSSNTSKGQGQDDVKLKKYILTEHSFQGSWKMCVVRQSGMDEARGRERLIFTVLKITTREGEGEESLFSSEEKVLYRFDLREFLEKSRKEQTTIRKRMNDQQLHLEKMEMDLGRPGHDEYLRKQAVLAKTKQTPRPVVVVLEEKEVTLCQCPKFATRGESAKEYENPKWWCLQCKTTECKLCTKEMCWIGLDSDHTVLEVENEVELAEKEMAKKLASSCRVKFSPATPVFPEYYEISMVDFKAEWRILKSSTVVVKF